jgi:hypothetical protein
MNIVVHIGNSYHNYILHMHTAYVIFSFVAVFHSGLL